MSDEQYNWHPTHFLDHVTNVFILIWLFDVYHFLLNLNLNWSNLMLLQCLTYKLWECKEWLSEFVFFVIMYWLPISLIWFAYDKAYTLFDWCNLADMNFLNILLIKNCLFFWWVNYDNILWMHAPWDCHASNAWTLGVGALDKHQNQSKSWFVHNINFFWSFYML